MPTCLARLRGLVTIISVSLSLMNARLPLCDAVSGVARPCGELIAPKFVGTGFDLPIAVGCCRCGERRSRHDEHAKTHKDPSPTFGHRCRPCRICRVSDLTRAGNPYIVRDGVLSYLRRGCTEIRTSSGDSNARPKARMARLRRFFGSLETSQCITVRYLPFSPLQVLP